MAGLSGVAVASHVDQDRTHDRDPVRARVLPMVVVIAQESV